MRNVVRATVYCAVIVAMAVLAAGSTPPIRYFAAVSSIGTLVLFIGWLRERSPDDA